jgi:hypothetical protein
VPLGAADPLVGHRAAAEFDAIGPLHDECQRHADGGHALRVAQ